MTLTIYLIDLDGTPVDSRRDIAESANAVLVECGCAPHSEDAIGEMVGDGAAMLIARAFAAAGSPAPADGLARFLRIYNDRLLRFTHAYAGIPELLATLASRGALAVLTNRFFSGTNETICGLPPGDNVFVRIQSNPS